jgi:hypothetical protein
MDRVAQGRSATLSQTFMVDGVPTNPVPDLATVHITRDDGTDVVPAGTSATEAGTGVVTYTLTPVHTALLDVLTVTWTATIGGLAQTFTSQVEIVGGFLFTIAEARALSALANTTVYPTAAIVEARTLVEMSLEDACGVAFVPRYHREIVSGRGASTILLSRPRVRALRSVNLDGAAITDLATIVPDPSGVAYYPTGWTRGFRNYEVAYEHGYDYPPPMATLAALTWAKAILVKGPIDDRTTAFTTEDGTFSMSTPGMRGNYAGIPVVDAFIQQYNLTAGIA